MHTKVFRGKKVIVPALFPTSSLNNNPYLWRDKMVFVKGWKMLTNGEVWAKEYLFL